MSTTDSTPAQLTLTEKRTVLDVIIKTPGGTKYADVKREIHRQLNLPSDVLKAKKNAIKELMKKHLHCDANGFTLVLVRVDNFTSDSEPGSESDSDGSVVIAPKRARGPPTDRSLSKVVFEGDDDRDSDEWQGDASEEDDEKNYDTDDSTTKLAPKRAKSAPKTRALALDDDNKCDACRQIATYPCGTANKAHKCGKQGKSPAQGDVGRCELKGKDKWAFPPCTIFMPKTAVPKVLGRPGSRGSNLLWTAQKHYKKHNVYKTTDAKGDTVYYAHEGSL